MTNKQLTIVNKQFLESKQKVEKCKQTAEKCKKVADICKHQKINKQLTIVNNLLTNKCEQKPDTCKQMMKNNVCMQFFGRENSNFCNKIQFQFSRQKSHLKIYNLLVIFSAKIQMFIKDANQSNVFFWRENLKYILMCNLQKVCNSLQY